MFFLGLGRRRLVRPFPLLRQLKGRPGLVFAVRALQREDRLVRVFFLFCVKGAGPAFSFSLPPAFVAGRFSWDFMGASSLSRVFFTDD